MKFETLVTRYKNLGYDPKGLERDLEIESIIKWIYENYNIWITTTFISVKMKVLGVSNYKKFCGHRLHIHSDEYFTDYFCDKYFTNPYDAKFDAVRVTHKGLKFIKKKN